MMLVLAFCRDRGPAAPTCVLLLRLPHASPPREGGLQVVVERPAAVQCPQSIQAGGLLPRGGRTQGTANITAHIPSAPRQISCTRAPWESCTSRRARYGRARCRSADEVPLPCGRLGMHLLYGQGASASFSSPSQMLSLPSWVAMHADSGAAPVLRLPCF